MYEMQLYIMINSWNFILKDFPVDASNVWNVKFVWNVVPSFLTNSPGLILKSKINSVNGYNGEALNCLSF